MKARELNQIEGLIRASLSPDSLKREYVVETAIEAAGGRSRSVMGLCARLILRALLSDRHWMVRNAAVEALEEIGTAADAFGVYGLLHDRSWMVRASACTTLAELHGRRAAPKLAEALKDKNPIVRRDAAIALSDVLGCDATDTLRVALDAEKNRKARVGFLFGLAKCGDKACLDELRLLSREDHPHLSSPSTKLLAEIE